MYAELEDGNAFDGSSRGREGEGQRELKRRIGVRSLGMIMAAPPIEGWSVVSCILGTTPADCRYILRGVKVKTMTMRQGMVGVLQPA